MYEGQLIRAIDGTWMTKPPSRCPTRRLPDPNQVLVGHVACLGHGGGGHTSWHCRTCDAVLYGPPLNSHCTALESGVHIKAVADLLGHPSIAITGDVYGHTSDDTARAAVDGLAGRLGL